MTANRMQDVGELADRGRVKASAPRRRILRLLPTSEVTLLTLTTTVEWGGAQVSCGQVPVWHRRSGDMSSLERRKRCHLEEAAPWRTFRWHYGQKHYSGTFWSATQSGHVVYESRLELARLLLADFDTSVAGIVAQPFLFVANVDGKQRKHIPDYLLITKDGPLVVDVKPLRHLTKPVVARTFAWTRAAVESRGWRYEVCRVPPAIQLANVRFLAGYRIFRRFEGERPASRPAVGGRSRPKHVECRRLGSGSRPARRVVVDEMRDSERVPCAAAPPHGRGSHDGEPQRDGGEWVRHHDSVLLVENEVAGTSQAPHVLSCLGTMNPEGGGQSVGIRCSAGSRESVVDRQPDIFVVDRQLAIGRLLSRYRRGYGVDHNDGGAQQWRGNVMTAGEIRKFGQHRDFHRPACLHIPEHRWRERRCRIGQESRERGSC
jgi:hypothetical protein